jgi:starch-binding outer membrane protein, SusD/RagB family
MVYATEDHFAYNYYFLRNAFNVRENIDLVPDMPEAEKEIVKAEMNVLVAFRYVEMLKRYGGVPIVNSLLRPDQDANIPRSSVQETLDFILRLCDEAAAVLDGHLWSGRNYGRVNKGVALAIKAEALTYAARPLFNANAPYLSMDDPADNPLIWLGGYSEKRWTDAIAASKAVIDWGKSNGFELINTGNPFDDFATAVGTLANKEVLLAFKFNEEGNYPALNHTFQQYNFINPSKQWWSTHGRTTLKMLNYFYKADGTDQDWPKMGDPPRPASEYREKAEEMSARCRASVFFLGLPLVNNLDGPNGTGEPLGRHYDIYAMSRNWSGLRVGTNALCGKNMKFWYQAGHIGRASFEMPIYRMAEFYLKIAEAYNAIGNSAEALSYLNKIRERAGLPAETNTDQAQLTEIIEREWAVEFYNELKYLPHVRHWKKGHEKIGFHHQAFNFTVVPGTGQVAWVPDQFVDYEVMECIHTTHIWFDRMNLLPIQRYEVNKGYLIQNPGY